MILNTKLLIAAATALAIVLMGVAAVHIHMRRAGSNNMSQEPIAAEADGEDQHVDQTPPVADAQSAQRAELKWQEPADVEFKAAADGTAQRYVEMLPQDYRPGQSVDLLIVLHGHGSDRWQYVRQERDECRAARDVALAHRMIYVSPDYRAATSWMGPLAEADLLQILAELRQRHQVRHVVLCGASMGGTSALIFAALHPDKIDAVVSQNGTANMLEFQQFLPAIAKSYGGTKEEREEEYRRRSPELFPHRFTMPIAFTVGGKDTVVPPDSVRRLAETLGQSRGHGVLMLDRPAGGHSTNYADTKEAIAFVLQMLEPQ